MQRFWEEKSLQEMSTDEWESLCDHCAKCCTIRLEDIDTGNIYSTNVVCRFLAQDTCQCQCYGERSTLVPDCITMTPDILNKLDWLPSTCAYHLVREKQPLPNWHPLETGKKDSTLESGNSIKGKVISEEETHPDDIENFILESNW